MSNDEYNIPDKECPYPEEQKIRKKVEEIIDFCTKNQKIESFFCYEKNIQLQVFELACMFFQLLLVSLEKRMDYSKWIDSGLYYKGDCLKRTIKTIFGEVHYWRSYLYKKNKQGFFPLDMEIGLTKDGFTPLVINLATKLATRVSFGAAVVLFKSFYRWSPSSEAIEALVLGMGRDASGYMEQIGRRVDGEILVDDGEILVIEVDGKATPTAKAEELEKRRGKRSPNKSCCKRHRNRSKRQCRAKRERRKKGDKSKNGRSITLAVMYTLKKGDDGKLHGPINKTVWGSYAPRSFMLHWARAQANKRGFCRGSDKRVHIVIDGEKCLYDGLLKLFPEASFALDIRHLEEKIWKTGHLFNKEGSDELSKWVEDKIEFLYTGQESALLAEFKELERSLSARAKRDKNKRETINSLIKYIEPRLKMMKYKELIDEDLVIASGIVEGAARYVIGERMDCSGMRWIPERAEALLRLRCIELNGDWDRFFYWGYKDWLKRMRRGEKVIIRQEQPDDLPDINFFDSNIADSYHEQEKYKEAA